MKRTLIAALFAVVCSIVAQAQAAQAPKPGPEHKKLGAFLGSWSVDGEIKPTNRYGMPAGKINVVERYQWMPGEFFLQMDREGKMAGADIKHMLMFGYDAGAKKHTIAWFGLTDGGGSMFGTGTNNGNTWMWSDNGHTAEGKPFQERCTITLVPNTSYTVKCDTSADGKTWLPAFEAKATKSKS